MIERNRKFRIPAIGDSMQDAPVRCKRFRDYVMIDDRTEELLMAAWEEKLPENFQKLYVISEKLYVDC